MHPPALDSGSGGWDGGKSNRAGGLGNPPDFDSFGRDFHPHPSPLTPQVHLRPMKGEEIGHPTHSALETLRLRSGRAECPIPRDGFPIGVGNDEKVIGRVAEPPARLDLFEKGFHPHPSPLPSRERVLDRPLPRGEGE